MCLEKSNVAKPKRKEIKPALGASAPSVGVVPVTSTPPATSPDSISAVSEEEKLEVNPNARAKQRDPRMSANSKSTTVDNARESSSDSSSIASISNSTSSATVEEFQPTEQVTF